MTTTLSFKWDKKREVSDLQKAWLIAYFSGANGSAASRSVGITNNVKQHACNMKAALMDVIQLNMRRMVGHCAPTALETVFELSQHCEDPKVRLAAARDLLDRAGYKEAAKIEVTIADKSDKELDSEIQELLMKGNIINAESVIEVV